MENFNIFKKILQPLCLGFRPYYQQFLENLLIEGSENTKHKGHSTFLKCWNFPKKSLSSIPNIHSRSLASLVRSDEPKTDTECQICQPSESNQNGDHIEPAFSTMLMLPHEGLVEILFCQITTFIKVHVTFDFSLQNL